ncbi:MAG TPA: recombination protein RecR [Rheinheimera sp.]|nr:recombination protein RecR [Rheinheimera sp.]
MARHTPKVQRLIDALRILPSVGPKSAQRIAYQLLERNRDGGLQLADALTSAMQGVGSCQQCRTFCEQELCSICGDVSRSQSRQLCVVASSADLYAIEHTGLYNGRYFVLRGLLSPLDGIGPAQLGLDQLAAMLSQAQFDEVILATNPTVEGEATAYFVAELCRKHQVAVSRLAQGMPVGGELEYVDGNTLSYAFSGRKQV